MTNETRFKIQKRTEYNEILSKNQKKLVDNTCLCGIGVALAAMLIASVTSDSTIDSFNEIISLVLATTDSIYSVSRLKNIIEILIENKILEYKIDELDDAKVKVYGSRY